MAAVAETETDPGGGVTIMVDQLRDHQSIEEYDNSRSGPRQIEECGDPHCRSVDGLPGW